MQNIIIPIAFFAASVILVVVIFNFILKMRLIAKGQTDPEALRIASSFDYKISTLKWGIILLFGGIGLIVIYYIPDANVLESPLPYGIEMIFLAIGFLIYYLIVRKDRPYS